MSAALGGDSAKSINDAFGEEFTYFAMNRDALRRFMPTPDRFPLFCELVEAAKKHYVSLPRHQRNALKYVPFHYFGRGWLVRARYVCAVHAKEIYLDLCGAPSKTVLVTVPVLVVESWDSP